MSIKDYLLMRTPRARLSGTEQQAAPGTVSGARIALSFMGIILGIIASFYVTGLRPATEPGSQPAVQSQQEKPPSRAVQEAPQPGVTTDFSLRRLMTVGLIALVICGITYQGLYFSLRLYQHEPAFLLIFVSFQYGYFWQSVVKGAATLMSA
jgi:hypothetical protein